MSIGLDVGTSFVISARDKDDSVIYKEFRDAFYKIKPASPIAGKMLEKGLAGKKFIKDSDGTYIILGSDAIEKAVERNESASRPMVKGVISPKEKDARKILKLILQEVVGKPQSKGEKLVYSVPGKPVDQGDEEFDIGYHEDVLRQDLAELGYDAVPLNEAEAICYSELEEEDYTGIALSFGAGMVNVCIMSNGEAIAHFSTTKSGDWVDRMVAQATGLPDSLVQAEKESGQFTIGEQSESQIFNACSAYYERLIGYTVAQLKATLEKSSDLPKFQKPLLIVIGGGTSRALGFVEMFNKKIQEVELPVQVKDIRHAENALRAVSRGCLLAANL